MAGFNQGLFGPVLIYGLAEAISRGITFVIFPVLTHLFTSADFGRISLLTSLGAFAGLAANCGLNNAVHRYYLDSQATDKSRKAVVSTGFSLLLVLSTGVAVVSTVLLFLAGDKLLDRVAVYPAFVALITIVPSQLLQYSQDVMRLHSTPWRYLLLAVAKSTFGLVFGIVLVVYLELGIWGYFVGLFCGQLVLIPWGLLLIRNDLSLKTDRKVASQMLTYGYPFIFAGLGQWVISSADLFILSQLRGISEVGIYSVGLRVTAIVMLATTAFSQAWAPAALRLHAENPDYRKIVGEMLPRIGGVLLYVAAGVSFFGKELLTWLTPPEYHAAALPLCFLSMSAAVSGTVQVTVLGLAFERRSDLIAKAIWGCAIVGVGVSFFMTWQFGLLGTAAANLITALMLTASYLFLTQSIHPLAIDYMAVRKMLFLGAIVLASAIFFGMFQATLPIFLSKVVAMLLVLFWGNRLGFSLPRFGK